MSDIFKKLFNGDFEKVKRIINEDPQWVQIKDNERWTSLDYAIACGKLDIAKFLFEKGGRPNLDEVYCDGFFTPVHIAAWWEYTTTLKWVLEKEVLPLRTFNIKNHNGWTPLDEAIMWGKLEIAKYLWENGGQPNLEFYCRDGSYTPMHNAARREYTANTLKWVFTKKILPLCVLQIKDEEKMTPLDVASGETATLFQNLIHLDSVFLAMQCAKKHDHNGTLLRRLPNELLDMVVDEVAQRFHLRVVW